MVKEFEELPSIYQFPIELQGIVLRIQKDSWNAAIRWVAENAKILRDAEYEWDVDEQSILNG